MAMEFIVNLFQLTKIKVLNINCQEDFFPFLKVFFPYFSLRSHRF